jgi:hypothetical protein
MRITRPNPPLLLSLCLAVAGAAVAVAHAAEPAAKPADTAGKPADPAAKPGETAAKSPDPASRPLPTGKKVDPAAIEALDKMGAYLRTLGYFAIDAETSTDEVLASGQKVQLGGLVQLKVRRPDRARVDIASDRRNQQIFYDGKALTLFGQRVNYYAAFPAPPRLGELIEVMQQEYGVEMPLADLFEWGMNPKATAAITAASDLGASTVKGVTCDHYAYRQPEVDWQIWIERGTKPLPRKLVITTMTEKAQPEHQVVMTWNLEPPLTEQTFTFVPPAGAQKIDIIKISEARRGAASAAAAGGAVPRQGRPSPQKKGPTP